MSIARAIAAAATTSLVPTVLLLAGSHIFVVIAVLEAATLAGATAYAVYLGLYRYPR